MSDAVLELLLKARDESGAAFSSFGGHLGGLSKGAKAATADTEELAGKKGGGLGSLVGSLGSMISPVTLAVAGVGALAAVGMKAFDTYKVDEVQIKALDTALTDHHMNVTQVTAAIDAQKSSFENLGYTVEDTRPAFTQLTEAGLTQTQMMAAMGPIMDLARAKHIDLTAAATMYTTAMMGSGKALKGFGILLPSVSASAADVGKATEKLTADHLALQNAQTNLIVVEDALKGKHTLTAAEAQKLQLAHEKVTAAMEKVKAGQEALTLAQQGGVDKGARLALMNQKIEDSIKNQKLSMDANAPIMAKLSDDWNGFAETVGPLVEQAFHGMLVAVSDVFDFIGSDAIPAAENLIGIIQALVGDVTNAVNAISHIPGVGLLSSAAGLAGKGLGDVASLIPHFDAGGVMPGAPGAPGLAVVHGGETVVPTGGGGGHTFNFNIGAVPDTGAMMLAIKRELTRQNMGFGTGY